MTGNQIVFVLKTLNFPGYIFPGNLKHLFRINPSFLGQGFFFSSSSQMSFACQSPIHQANNPKIQVNIKLYSSLVDININDVVDYSIAF